MMKLHTSDLVKRYKTRTVVNEVSVEVQQGEIVGLLGPNGAGKTKQGQVRSAGSYFLFWDTALLCRSCRGKYYIAGILWDGSSVG